MRVLCMGEALIDVIHQPTGEVEERVGGSIFNVARGLARLDLDTTLASWWGPDDRGKLLQAAAEAAGLQIIPGTDRAAQTSIARAEVDPTGHATFNSASAGTCQTSPTQMAIRTGISARSPR